MTLTEAVRRRLWFVLSPDVAQAAGLQLHDLQLFLSHSRTLSAERIADLARTLSIKEPVR